MSAASTATEAVPVVDDSASAVDATSGALDDSILTPLRQIADRQIYPAGAFLTREGERGHTFYIVESGAVLVSRTLDDGSVEILNRLGPLESFGELALLDDSPRIADVATVVETEVLEITAERFRNLVRQDPDLALYITRRILANLRKLDRLSIENLRTKNELLQQAYFDLQAAQAQLVEQKRLERELELAADVQRSLLPATLPQLPGYRFASYLAPARHVGGDFFDVRVLDDEHVGVLIADVADKGMHAALMMAVSRTLFFQEIQRLKRPAAVVQAVHRGLLAMAGDQEGWAHDAFVTAFYGLIHRPSGHMTYVRAAQDRPLLWRTGSKPEPLPGDGRFLGMMEGLVLDEYTVTLRPGDFLLLYSDGVPDATNPDGVGFGLDRLMAAIRAAAASSAEATLDKIVADIVNWTGDAQPFDDITMLLAEVL